MTLAYRRELFDAKLQKADVIQAYKDEISDWCHHDLAVELVSDRLGISKQTVQICVANQEDIW